MNFVRTFREQKLIYLENIILEFPVTCFGKFSCYLYLAPNVIDHRTLVPLITNLVHIYELRGAWVANCLSYLIKAVCDIK